MLSATKNTERMPSDSQDRALYSQPVTKRPRGQGGPPVRGLASRMVLVLLRGLLRALFRIELTGDQGVFVNQRTLIVANHESFLDGLLLAIFLPVNATFVVHREITNSAFVRGLLRFVPHLMVDSASPMAIKLICRLVETGTPVVIFPEGRLTVTGSLMKVYDGAGFVAARTGATETAPNTATP